MKTILDFLRIVATNTKQLIKKFIEDNSLNNPIFIGAIVFAVIMLLIGEWIG